MFGGKGIYMGFDDYLKLLTGRTNVWNGQDKWNGIAGLDFRWRFPSLGGMQLYGELYSEDNVIFGDWKADNSRMLGLIAGLYVPRLSPSGNWDLGLEFASTGYNVPACQDTKLKNLSYILLPFLSAYAAIRYC